MGLWASFKNALLRERKSPWARRRPRTGPEAGGHRKQRGVALVMVLGSVAILTAVAIEFQYQSNVDLQLAVNARDELRADYLARSSVNMSRLLLRFQKQVDGQTAGLGQALQALGMSGAGGAAGGGGGGINIRLWEIIPIDCNLFNMLLGGGKVDPGTAPEAPKFGEGLDTPGGAGALNLKGEKAVLQSFGDFEGCFSATISDEEQKLNLNRLNGGAATGRAPMMQALLAFADPRFEFVYEKPDANGVKMTAHETIIAIHDWIDERDTGASLNLTGSGDPYPDGFGDENHNYMSKYPFRYRAKNAALDTLDELYQVDGVSDLFMAAFRDRLTVYADKNKPLNINTNDPIQQYLNIVGVAASESDPKLNPLGVTIQLINEQIAMAKMFSFMGMSASTFVNIVKSNGIKINPTIEANMQNNAWITDKSETFTVKATGQAGRVERTVTAVVRYNDQLGKVLYYRQE
ncbi:MAG: type II secretion system protein GspK [Myxococcales bacterium]